MFFNYFWRKILSPILFLASTKANSRKRGRPSESNADSGSEIGEPVSRKRKSDFQGEYDEMEISIRRQNEEFHKLFEQINESIDKEGQVIILKHNNQYVPRDKKEVT